MPRELVLEINFERGKTERVKLKNFEIKITYILTRRLFAQALTENANVMGSLEAVI